MALPERRLFQDLHNTGDRLHGSPLLPAIPLAIATSNPGKLDRFQQVSPPDASIISIKPLFDEDEIKAQIGISEEDGYAYTAGISRTKLQIQREALKKVEGSTTDYTVIVSDSVVLVPDGENMVAINRDGMTDEKREAVMEHVNRERQITYVGALSFGRKNGQAAYTVLTFCTVPLDQPITSYPLEVKDLPTIQDKTRDIEVGYIEYRLDKAQGFVSTHRTIETTQDFEKARPYISGITPEIMALANDFGRFDALTGPITSTLVGKNPFNTLTPHGEVGSSNQYALQKYYEKLIEQRQTYFDANGGNCTLFSLALADKLQEAGLDPQVIIYPSTVPDQNDGHSGLLVSQGERKYWFDPGLSLTHAVPIDRIPLVPFVSGSKSLSVGAVPDETDPRQLPDIHLQGPDGRIRAFSVKEIVTPSQFEELAPGILQRLHQGRRTLKLDYHTENGTRVIGFALDARTERLKIRHPNVDVKDMSLGDFLAVPAKRAGLGWWCHQNGVDFSYILDQLLAVQRQRAIESDEIVLFPGK